MAACALDASLQKHGSSRVVTRAAAGARLCAPKLAQWWGSAASLRAACSLDAAAPCSRSEAPMLLLLPPLAPMSAAS